MQLEMYPNVKRMIQIGETYLGGISVRFFSVAHTVNNLQCRSPLEKGMVTHASILAWRIPWTEESSGLQSTGWQRVRHD